MDSIQYYGFDGPNETNELQPQEIIQLKQQSKLTKDLCRTMPCSLTNIVEVLRVAFQELSFVDNQDLILAYGNTGSGKSTLFTSLVFGPEALTLKTIETESKVPIENGQTKTIKKKERVIDQKVQRGVF